MPIGTNFKKGLSVYGVPLFPNMGGLMPTGNVFWVDSTNPHPVDMSSFGQFATPFNTIAYAITQCVAGNDDCIMVMPGHVEKVSSAGGLTFSVNGITVVFLGNGDIRGTVTFTATAATMIVTASDVKIYGPRFLTGIDAVAAAINVQAADFNMYNAEYYDQAAMATTVQILTTVAANRMILDGYKYFASTTGTQKTSAIQLVGASDSAQLRNMDIGGNFSVANVNNSSGAMTNLLLDSVRVANSNATPKPAIALVSTTGGVGQNVVAQVASGAQFTSTNVLAWLNSVGSVIGTGGGAALTASN